MNIPVFVISMESSPDRRENTIRQLDHAGVKYRFTRAVDGRDLSDTDIRKNPAYGVFRTGIYSRLLRKEEIGCTLSHLNIYRQITDEDIPLACVLEDDNNYSSDFSNLLKRLEQDHADWDILYLGHRSECTSNEAEGERSKRLDPLDYFTGEPFEAPYGSHGYVITKRAAMILTENAYPVKAPVDVYIGNSAVLGLRIKLLHPPCVISNPGFSSTIQAGNTIVTTNSVTGAIRNTLRKNTVIFGMLKNSTIKFRILRNSALRFLRKNGVIKNKYARTLK